MDAVSRINAGFAEKAGSFMDPFMDG